MSDKNKAIQLLRERVIGTNMGYTPKVYLRKEATNAPALNTWGKSVQPSSNFNVGEGVFTAFIDLMPGANYEHPVQYAFINEQSEIVEVVDATTPPNDLDENFEKVVMEE